MATKEEYLKVKKELDGILAKEKALLRSRLQTIDNIEQVCKMAEALATAFAFEDKEKHPEYPCIAKSKHFHIEVVATGKSKKEGYFEGVVLVGDCISEKGYFCDSFAIDSFTFEPL
jgi:hypothetical protein